MTSTMSSAFGGSREIAYIDSFLDMESLIIRSEELKRVIVRNNMDFSVLENVVKNLMIWDIRLAVSKGSDGWVFDIERGVFNF